MNKLLALITLILFSLSCGSAQKTTPLSEQAPLIRACWTTEGLPKYLFKNKKASCTHPKVVRFPRSRLPLRVKWLNLTEAPMATKALKAAIEDINNLLGAEVLVLGTVGWDIVVVDVKENNTFIRAYATHRKDHGHLIGTVVSYALASRGSFRTTKYTYMHEFGHILGLDHNTGSEKNMMYPTSLPNRAGFSKASLKYLRKHYGAKR